MEQYVLRIVVSEGECCKILDGQTALLKESFMEYIPFELQRWARFQKMKEAYLKQKQSVRRDTQLGKSKAVRTVWLERWFSTQIGPTAGRVSGICAGGFDCHMIGGAGL